jgi:hypothetical protein
MEGSYVEPGCWKPCAAMATGRRDHVPLRDADMPCLKSTTIVGTRL